MPILSDPDQIFPLVLDCDKDKPPATRPTFFARANSARQQRELYKMLDEIAESRGLDDIFDRTFSKLTEKLVDWKNMSIPFDPTKFEDVLPLEEARELLRMIARNQFVQEDEKKSSES